MGTTPRKGPADYLVLGDWNTICFVCGKKFKASEMRKHWKGYWVCSRDWEPRHPQDFVRATADVVTPPWVQPEPADNILVQCTLQGQMSVGGYAVAGCMVAGVSFNPGWVTS